MAYQLIVLVKNDLFGRWAKKNLVRLGPFCVLSFINGGDDVPQSSPAYLKKPVNNQTTVYVCHGFVCSAPITSIKEMKNWIEKNTLLDTNIYV